MLHHKQVTPAIQESRSRSSVLARPGGGYREAAKSEATMEVVLCSLWLARRLRGAARDGDSGGTHGLRNSRADASNPSQSIPHPPTGSKRRRAPAHRLASPSAGMPHPRPRRSGGGQGVPGPRAGGAGRGVDGDGRGDGAAARAAGSGGDCWDKGRGGEETWLIRRSVHTWIDRLRRQPPSIVKWGRRRGNGAVGAR